jgi:large subunit ribosomal protein L21
MYSNFPVTGRRNRVGHGEVKIGEIMLYAIVESGGKQYKAVEGGTIEVDLLPVEVGTKKTFDKVLLLVDDDKVEVGTPILTQVSVDTTVTAHFKGPKITIFKYRAKERYRVKTGHRQQYTRVSVDSIAFPGKVAKPAKVEEVKEAPKAAPKSTAKAPAKKSAASAKKAPAKASAAKSSTAAKKSTAATKKKSTATAKKSTTAAKKTTTAAKKTSSTAKKAADKKKSTDK